MMLSHFSLKRRSYEELIEVTNLMALIKGGICLLVLWGRITKDMAEIFFSNMLFQKTSWACFSVLSPFLMNEGSIGKIQIIKIN